MKPARAKSPAKTRSLLLEPATDIRGIATEQENPRSKGLDQKSAQEIARIINEEDQGVPKAIAQHLDKIAAGIDAISAAFRAGGSLIYVGTGTSGRLGALDSSECPPTYNADPKMVQYVIAGGDAALGHAVEASEDSPALGRKDIAQKRPTKKDVVCGLAASGRTPYTVAALEYAREKGAKTICVTANPNSPIVAAADIPIAIPVGPEVVAGSTRMKAGTMQKLVLNMLTTGAFTKVGYVYENLMVNVHLKNKKLVERGVGIVQQLTGLDHEASLDLLRRSNGSVPVALVMHKTGEARSAAEKRLKKAGGNVRVAIG